MDINITRYELKVDSLGATIDTLSIEQKKTNENGVVVFNEKSFYRENSEYIKSAIYYRDNENLFYSKLESSELGTLSVTEFWEKDNEILNGISYRYKNDSIIDSTIISYKYFYDENNNKRKIIITSFNEDEELNSNKTELHFNNDNNIVSELYLQNRDTLATAKYYYEDNLLRKKVINNHENDNLTLYDYDGKGRVLKEIVFGPKDDSMVQISETIYITDENGVIKESFKTWKNSDLKEHFIFKGY